MCICFIQQNATKHVYLSVLTAAQFEAFAERSRGRPLLFSLVQLWLKLLGTYISVAALLNILTFYTIESRGKTQVSCIWMCMTFLLKAKSRGSGKWHTDLAWSVGDAERLIFEEQHHPWRIWECSGIVLILIIPCRNATHEIRCIYLFLPKDKPLLLHSPVLDGVTRR